MSPVYEWLLRPKGADVYEVRLWPRKSPTFVFKIGASATVIAADHFECTCEQFSWPNRAELKGCCKHVLFVLSCFGMEQERLLSAYELATGERVERLSPSLPFDLLSAEPAQAQPPIADYPTDDPTSFSEIDPFGRGRFERPPMLQKTDTGDPFAIGGR